MNNKTIKLSEKVWEDFVWEYSSKFLEKGLKKFTRQYTDKTGRSDLVFKDKDGDFLIVEIQMKGIDRKHMHRAMDYRDDLLEKKNLKKKDIRILLLCNSLNEKQRYYLDRHKLELKTISELKVRKIIRQIDPKIQFTESKEEIEAYNDFKDLKIWKEKDKIRSSGDLIAAYEKYKEDADFIANTKLNYIKNNKTLTPALRENFCDLNIDYNDKKFQEENDRLILHPNTHPEIRLLKSIENLRQEIRAVESDRFYIFDDALDEIKSSIYQKQFCKTLYNYKYLDHEKLLMENRKPKIDLIIWPGSHYKHHDYFWLYWQPSNWIYHDGDLSNTNADFKFKDLWRWTYGSHYKDRWDFNILCLRAEWFYRGVGIDNLRARFQLLLNNLIHSLMLNLSNTFHITMRNKFSFKTKKLDTYDKILVNLGKSNIDTLKVENWSSHSKRNDGRIMLGPEPGKR